MTIRRLLIVLIAGGTLAAGSSALGQLTLPSPSQPLTPPPDAAPATPTKSPAAQPSEPAKRTEPVAEFDLRPKFTRGSVFRLRMETASTSESFVPGLSLDTLEKPAGTKPANKQITSKPKPAPGKSGKPPARSTKPPTVAPTSNPTDLPADAGENGDLSTASQVYTLVFKTRSVDEAGGAVVDVTFESITMKVDAAGMHQEFDSSKPAPKPAPPSDDPLKSLDNSLMLEGLIRPLVGETLTLTIDNTGKITKVEGGEKFSALFSSSSTPGSPPASTQSLFGGIFSLSPARTRAHVGESWTTDDTLNLSILGSIRSRTVYTMNSASGSLAKIGMNGKMSPVTEQPAGTVFTLKDLSNVGEYAWDSAAGFLDSMKLTQKFTGQMKLGELSGNISSTQSVTVTRLREGK